MRGLDLVVLADGSDDIIDTSMLNTVGINWIKNLNRADIFRLNEKMYVIKRKMIDLDGNLLILIVK